VMEAIKILNNQFNKCCTVYLTKKPNPRKKILVPCQLNEPNPKCYVCSEKREIGVKLDIEKVTLKTFEDKVLKGTLNMVAPDAEIDGKGVVIISSDEDETSTNNEKVLKDLGIADGTILSCDDFLQDYNIRIFIYNCSELKDGVEFELVGDLSKLEQQNEAAEEEKVEAEEVEEVQEVEKNGNGHQNGANGDAKNGEEERKRKPADDKIEEVQPAKKAKLADIVEEDDDIVCID